MMKFDCDKFLPAMIMMSHSHFRLYISRYQCEWLFHFKDDTAKQGNQYASTNFASLPWPGDSPCTSPSFVTVQNNRQEVDTGHIILSLPVNSQQHTTPSLVQMCNNQRHQISLCILPNRHTLKLWLSLWGGRACFKMKVCQCCWCCFSALVHWNHASWYGQQLLCISEWSQMQSSTCA